MNDLSCLSFLIKNTLQNALEHLHFLINIKKFEAACKKASSRRWRSGERIAAHIAIWKRGATATGGNGIYIVVAEPQNP